MKKTSFLIFPLLFALMQGAGAQQVNSGGGARFVEKISFEGNKQVKSDVIRNFLRRYIGKVLDESQIRSIVVQLNNYYTKQKIPVVVSYYTVKGGRPDTSSVHIKVNEGALPKNSVQVASRTTKRGVPQLPNQDSNKVALSTPNGKDWAANYDNRDQRLEIRTTASNVSGATLTANYGILLSPNVALGTNLSYGPAYTEWLLTGAADLPANMRLHLTGGQLKRKDNYTFQNGDVDAATVTQNMYLASIGKSFEKSFLNEISLKAYGAQAIDSNSKAKLYVINNPSNAVGPFASLVEDPRTLALGKMTGTQVAARLALSASTSLGISAGNESLEYKYANGTNDKSSKFAGQLKLSTIFANCWAAEVGYGTSVAAKSKVDLSVAKGALSVNASQTQPAIEGQSTDTRIGVAYNLIGDRSQKIGCKRFSTSAYAKGALLDDVVTRPSELPTSVFAKVDHTVKLKERINVDSANIQGASLSLDESGVLFINIPGVSALDGTVTQSGKPFPSSAITVVANGVRVDLEKLPAVAAGTDDVYEVPMNGGKKLKMVVENS